MGSRPCRPVLVSLKFGLSPLVINENTHRIWLVDFPQAKLTWLGSETTLGFWQALLISFCTTATLAGHEAPGRNTTRISTVRPTTAAATHIAIFCLRPTLPRGTLRRPWSIRALVRSSTRLRPATRGSLRPAIRGSPRPATLGSYRPPARRAVVLTGSRDPAGDPRSGRPATRRNDSCGGLGTGSAGYSGAPPARARPSRQSE